MVDDNHGFTLLEVLTALAIASIIVLAVTTTLFGLNRAHSRASDIMDQQRAVRNSLDLLRRELSSTLYRSTDILLRFQVQDRDYYGKQASTLIFATLVPPQSGELSDQTLVQYKTEELDEILRLSRASRDYFVHDTVKSTDYPLIEKIDGFLVECHDGTKWVRTWDTELTKRLPREIRVTLSVQDGNKTVSFQITAVPKIEPQ